jgi:hypothetical protein
MPDEDPKVIDGEIVEPTDAEIAAAAAVEAKDAAAEAKRSDAAKRGPGRPPGAKNKTAATKTATTRATTTRTTSSAPKSTPAAITGMPDLDAATRADRKRVKDERAAHVAQLTGEMLQHRTSVVRAVGMATGLPGQFLVGVAVDENNAPIVDENGRQVEALTAYGQALAPQEWQVKTCVEAYVRLEETEQGQKMLATMDRFMPYALMVGALGALGMYTMTVLQASQAIKPMIAQEMQAQAAANDGLPPQAPGASGGAPG